MIKRVFAAAIVCFVVAACSESTDRVDEVQETAPKASETAKPDIVAELVERFEAPACAMANPVGALKKTSPDGLEIIRAYSAKGACLNKLEQALAARGFKSQGQGGFIIGEGEAKTEFVTIERAQGGENGGIQWEIVER